MAPKPCSRPGKERQHLPTARLPQERDSRGQSCVGLQNAFHPTHQRPARKLPQEPRAVTARVRAWVQACVRAGAAHSTAARGCLRGGGCSLLLGEVALGDGVQEHAADGDARAERALRRDGVPEDDDGHDDDHDPLERVEDAVRDRLHAGQDPEGGELVHEEVE
eukprot:CAMPEP_0175735580 /NCGR_PEP_ID=MMETSP0097-20121207/52973_1 /TAXON_ID=311494 /ORGANISM="Alexandrium monilatum, Strain CCMP3105" /LENGTH=163 /DNA_ID=CAMNT_0017043639 /DNA_START=43 /DNA_END=531 /DNA_ORIENTATION=+